MKINIFRVPVDAVDDLTVDLEENDYTPEADKESDGVYYCIYLRKNHTANEGWLAYYKSFVEKDIYDQYVENIGNESVSGAFLIKTAEYSYVVSHGQAHFIIRKYCDKDFGLNLAERIVDAKGLKMKHSQTFTSAGKKDITSYLEKKNLEDSHEYGEAFSYVKCKTIDKKKWGETADFGESVRLSFGRDISLKPDELIQLTDRIEDVLQTEAIIRLPRYRKVTDKLVLARLKDQLKHHFIDFLTRVAVDDYWLTGVSFSFLEDFHYSLRFRQKDLSGILTTIDSKTVIEVAERYKELIGDRHDLIRVVFYDENGDPVFSRSLIELIQATIDLDGKYYVLFHNEWVEFSDSYVEYIKQQVDLIQFSIKDIAENSETELIDHLAASGEYKQLHKHNTYIGQYCIETADLMDADNVIMVKGQHQEADLVYLIKQATTSLRLASTGEIKENVFEGRNVCLWMLVNRKNLQKLSDFRSFHLLDALNDFKQEVTNKNLTPVVWISLNK